MSVFERFSAEKKVLDIIIVGCGKVGTSLVDRLSSDGHHITVIDKNQNIVTNVTNTYDAMGIVGNGSSYNIQIQAGIEDADLLIAVTDSDELNLLCCIIAKKVGDCASIARVRNPDYASEFTYLREKLGISMILNPELETANEIARLLRVPNALNVNSFASGQAELIRFRVPEKSSIAGKTLSEITSNIDLPLLICAAEKSGELIVPNGSYLVEKGDALSFITTPKIAHSFFKRAGIATGRVSNAMIIGGGKTTYYLAHQLIDMGIDVKIIEEDPQKCEDLSLAIDKALVICGDGTDEELLRQEGLMSTDALIPLTGIDEENILISVFAKRISDSIKIVTKVSRSTFKSVVDSFDVGIVIYPREIVANMIVTYVRAKQNSIGSNVETLYHIFDNRAEAIEFRIEENSEVTNKTLSELELKDDILIACINRQGKIIIPSGSDEIWIGDTVILITTRTGVNNVTDILKR
ncbi:MAG: Trk system potassium transporter TrkA [Ruminococcus sp.]|nr:Trk system potassium transporter TrkA [Ruminococcus sp.]